MEMTQAVSLAPVQASEVVRADYCRFIDSCRTEDERYRLTPRSEPSPYALCFAIFGLHLIRRHDVIDAHRRQWDTLLRGAVRALAAARETRAVPALDKPYLQLLTFTLSALSILDTLGNDPLADLVLPLLPSDIEGDLRTAGAAQGHARSGNHAMFLGILILHARERLGIDTQPSFARWVQLHRSWMNRFGFWGDDRSMSHLQFQNGYHQYELLEYAQVPDLPWQQAADAVASLADPEGHFAPYPGGGGCYDYDAVFMLTGTRAAAQRHAALLSRTGQSILSEQNADGGFCESRRIRPRSVDNLRRSWQHVRCATGKARVERLRQALTLLRPRHDRVATHWSAYSREWGESDLWDSWFRMLTLARIECAFVPERASAWGFIDFPGIGFHPSVRHREHA